MTLDPGDIESIIIERNRYRSALYDVVVGKPCSVEIGASLLPCKRSAVGVIKMNEVGWVRSCEQHMDDDDEDGCIRLVSKRTAN